MAIIWFQAKINKMKFSLFLSSLFFLIPNICESQEVRFTGKSPCEDHLYLNSHLFKDYPELLYNNFLKDYIEKNYPGSQNHMFFSNEKLLKFINIVNLPNKQIFEINSIETKYRVSIFFKRKRFSMDLAKIDNDDYLIIENMIEDSLGYNYFGSFEKDSVIEIKYIDQIILTADNIETALFEDMEFKKLINPNTCLNYRGLRPLEIYYSPDYQKIFIYVFGEIHNGEFLNMDYASARKSYLAKIIIDTNASPKMILNIIPGGYLGTYGWLECKDYNKWWGF